MHWLLAAISIIASGTLRTHADTLKAGQCSHYVVPSARSDPKHDTATVSFASDPKDKTGWSRAHQPTIKTEVRDDELAIDVCVDRDATIDSVDLQWEVRRTN